MDDTIVKFKIGHLTVHTPPPPKKKEVGEEIKMPKLCDRNECTNMTTYLEKYCLNTTHKLSPQTVQYSS